MKVALDGTVHFEKTTNLTIYFHVNIQTEFPSFRVISKCIVIRMNIRSFHTKLTNFAKNVTFFNLKETWYNHTLV
jgi:hypothetical protein